MSVTRVFTSDNCPRVNHPRGDQCSHSGMARLMARRSHRATRRRRERAIRTDLKIFRVTGTAATHWHFHKCASMGRSTAMTLRISWWMSRSPRIFCRCAKLIGFPSLMGKSSLRKYKRPWITRGNGCAHVLPGAVSTQWAWALQRAPSNMAGDDADAPIQSCPIRRACKRAIRWFGYAHGAR